MTEGKDCDYGQCRFDGTNAHEHVRWECPDFEDDPEHFGFSHIFYWKHEGGYDWIAVGIFRRLEDGGPFFYVGSGCSCNSPADDLPLELEPLTESNLDSFLRQVFEVHDISGADKVAIMRVATKAALG